MKSPYMITQYAINHMNASIKNKPFFSKSSNVATTVPFLIDLSEFHILNGRDSDIAEYHSTSALEIQVIIYNYIQHDIHSAVHTFII